MLATCLTDVFFVNTACFFSDFFSEAGFLSAVFLVKKVAAENSEEELSRNKRRIFLNKF